MQPKYSFFNSIKQFFNDAPDEDIIVNEASSTLPSDTKSKLNSQISTNHKASDPNVFKIDNEDEGNQIYEEEEDQES